MSVSDFESSSNIDSIAEVSWWRGLDCDCEWNTALDGKFESSNYFSSSSKTVCFFPINVNIQQHLNYKL